jgi:hypothetical protein
MTDDTKDIIQLKDTDALKGVCLCLYSDDVNKIEVFKHLCYGNLPKNLGWFHQCNTRQFQMFEFWKPHHDAMVMISQRIAQEMRLPFEEILTKSYPSDGEVVVSDFIPFQEEFHKYDNFFG